MVKKYLLKGFYLSVLLISSALSLSLVGVMLYFIYYAGNEIYKRISETSIYDFLIAGICIVGLFLIIYIVDNLPKIIKWSYKKLFK